MIYEEEFRESVRRIADEVFFGIFGNRVINGPTMVSHIVEMDHRAFTLESDYWSDDLFNIMNTLAKIEAGIFSSRGEKLRDFLSSIKVVAQIEHGLWYKAFIFYDNQVVRLDTSSIGLETTQRVYGLKKSESLAETNLFALLNNYLSHEDILWDDRIVEKVLLHAYKQSFSNRQGDKFSGLVHTQANN